jgi:hypothetical protein
MEFSSFCKSSQDSGVGLVGCLIECFGFEVHTRNNSEADLYGRRRKRSVLFRSKNLSLRRFSLRSSCFIHMDNLLSSNEHSYMF